MKLFAPHLIDGYKYDHRRQYPAGTEYIYSNFTPRSDKNAQVLPDFDHKVVFFGLQGVCKWLFQDLWNETFFDQRKSKVIDKYKKRVDSYFGKDVIPVEHMEALHELGYLPIHIKALKEGSRVNIRVPVLTLCNTLPDFSWVTNYLETQLSNSLWKSITTATTAYEYYRLFKKWAGITGGLQDFVKFQAHDFSARGLCLPYDAAANGAAHLLCFNGTDNVAAMDYAEEYYGTPVNSDSYGATVPATEHSVMCVRGETGEVETMRSLLEDVYPNGIVSMVIDTWDFFRALTEYTVILKDKIMARDGKAVFRPDTGDPVKIICGDPSAPIGTNEQKGAIQCLWEIFGGTTNADGFRSLDPHVGLIYGDSITLERAQQIMSNLHRKGFTSDNVVLGVGSYTYQYVTRDTFGTAIKATSAGVNGKPVNMFKSPKTGDGMKNSACGLLRVEFENGNYVLYDNQTPEQESQGLLESVFKDGMFWRFEHFEEIQERLMQE